MRDTYQPDYSEAAESIAHALNRIADDADENATLRDRFALAALQGLIAQVESYSDGRGKVGRVLMAEEAYDFADAMLLARAPKLPALCAKPDCTNPPALHGYCEKHAVEEGL